MLIDRRSWPQHRPWFMFVVAVAIAATAWEAYAGLTFPRFPGGSSLPGFTFGVAGGLVIVFECLLWLKKKFRVWRIGRAQTWMRAHIWLGLLSVPLVVYHTGFHLGGSLSTVLTTLFALAIASGIWGLAVQQALPRKMLDEVPSETIYSQIEDVMAHFRKEADRLVMATCGPAEDSSAPLDAAEEEEERVDAFSHLTIGAVRQAGRVQGKVLLTRVPPAPVPGSEPLRHFYHSTIAPYLSSGARSRSPLRYASRSATLFAELRTRLDPAAHETVSALEGLCEQRRQLDHEARLHFWLHNWLWVHLPVSAALLVLLFVHAWYAVMYW
ncbi:MAG TPA: hypothetical protein VGY53_10130 [Isosphaeraceae bacterium]|nr:hypothetical protein [Isosphaeraceae bacterium]